MVIESAGGKTYDLKTGKLYIITFDKQCWYASYNKDGKKINSSYPLRKKELYVIVLSRKKDMAFVVSNLIIPNPKAETFAFNKDRIKNVELYDPTNLPLLVSDYVGQLFTELVGK